MTNAYAIRCYDNIIWYLTLKNGFLKEEKINNFHCFTLILKKNFHIIL